jgi:hypothetical protein
MIPLASTAEVSVQTGVIDGVGWVLTVGGILVTALWIRHLTR